MRMGKRMRMSVKIRRLERIWKMVERREGIEIVKE